MRGHRRLVARTAVAIGVLTLTSAVGPAASAASGVGIIVAPAAGIPTAGRHNVVPQCNAGAGVATSLNQFSFAIVGTAEAYATDVTPVIATGVYCIVKDRVTGEVYGQTVPRAFPGPYAASEGVIPVPFNSDPMMCGYANALFANNAVATGKTSDPKC